MSDDRKGEQQYTIQRRKKNHEIEKRIGRSLIADKNK
jgi:hypothetical protein